MEVPIYLYHPASPRFSVLYALHLIHPFVQFSLNAVSIVKLAKQLFKIFSMYSKFRYIDLGFFIVTVDYDVFDVKTILF